MSLWRLPLLGVLSLVFSLVLPAATEEEADLPRFHEEVAVIGRVPPARAVQSVTVVTGDDSARHRIDGLKGVLNEIPGFLVLSPGHPGQTPYAFARGASINQMLFLYNGIPLSDPSSSLGGSYPLLPATGIERIEVVRGPMSNLLGTGAMGGAVNLRSRSQEGLEAGMLAGSHGSIQGDLSGTFVTGLGKVAASADFLSYSDGQANDRFRRRGGSLTLTTGGRNWELAPFLYATRVDSGIPIYLSLPSPHREYSQDHWLVSLPWRWQPLPVLTLRLSGSWQTNHYDFNDPDDTWAPLVGNSSRVTDLSGGADWHPAAGIHFEVGGAASLSRASSRTGSSVELDDARQDLWSAFVLADLARGDATASLSLRYDRPTGQPGVFSPQMGFSYRIRDLVKVRTSLGRSFRAPTAAERFNPMWGNGDLRPEKGKSMEIGADLLLHHGSVSITAFRSSYANLIGFSPLTGRYANLTRATVNGWEASAQGEIARGLRLEGSYTSLSSNDAQYDRQLLRRPRNAWTARLTYDHRRFMATVSGRYVGKRLDYDEMRWNVGRSPGFDSYDAAGEWRFSARLAARLQLTNLADASYQEVLGYPSPGRRIMAGIVIRQTAGGAH